MQLKLVIGITGASGSLYAMHFIRALSTYCDGESRLIISDSALRVFREEIDDQAQTPTDLLKLSLAGTVQKHSFQIEDHRDIGARSASGSSKTDGMVIVPCSMKTMAAVAHGYTSNLIERAADVTLKERRKLIVVPRESPYSLIHLKNMTALTEAGGIVLPASPAFYQKPQSFDDLGRFIAGRILNLFGVEHDLFKIWQG